MNKTNLTALLKAIRAMIMRERVAYKDYLGEETVTRLLISGTFAGGDMDLLTLEDPTFAGFVVGETYQVTIDGETTDCVAYLFHESIIVSVGELKSDNFVGVDISNGNAFGVAVGEYVGKSITVSQTKTTKKYRTKKLPMELLPDGLAKSADVLKVASAVKNAQTTAETAQTTAETAQTTAETAQTTAETAQTTAETAQTTAETVASGVSPHDKNYYAALFSKNDAYAGWWSVWPELHINTTDGFIYKDAWSPSTPLEYSNIPSPFVAEVHYKYFDVFVRLNTLSYNSDRMWSIDGVGVSEDGKIYRIKTNKIPYTQSTGFAFTFTERDDLILSTPQTLTEEQKQQARENIGVDNTLGITGATVGQVPKITAVDADGKPTAWEAVDMPNGANLDTIEVYVADFNATDGLTVTTGAVDRYARVVVS